MPGGKALRLGPFSGGLNTGSDESAIADAELVSCLNFELDIDGSLVSRPPIQELEGPNSTVRILLLCEANFSGASYIIGSNSSGVFYYLNGTWTLITSSFEATAAVQYAGFVYFISPPNSGMTSGKWNPSGGYTAVGAIPRGRSLAIHKERLFVGRGSDATTSESRLQFSNVGNFDVWSASDFIDIAQGDGSKLIDLTVYQDNLLLFKDNSTYVLAYDIRPTDAVVRKISPTIGVEQEHCIINYENQVYVFHNGWIYEIINYDFNRLNTKVPFIRDETAPSPFASFEKVFLSIFADRIVCRYYARVYVYGLRTRTFSEWTSEADKLKFFGPILTIHPTTGDEYYAGSCISAYNTLLQLRDKSTATSKEQILNPPVSTTDTFTRTVSSNWGTADTGEVWTTLTSPASDFSTNGSNGLISLGSVNAKRALSLNRSMESSDVVITVSSPVVATGNWIVATVDSRVIDLSNYYEARVEFKNTGNVGVSIYRTVAGSTVFLLGGEIGTYSANELHTLRFRVNGSSLKARLWKSASVEPVTWTVSVTDSSIVGSGSFAVGGFLTTGNTNTLPVALKFDDFKIGAMTDVLTDIVATLTTKNFDMAVPNQFKRLWWWGADVSTDRDIVGTATPIVISFNATWDSLSSRSWNSLNTWNQPLASPVGVVSTVSTGTGTARRFAKFLKALRYRQINFSLTLTTDGSTVDGPAKLFTMTLITETKETVSKALS